MHLPKVVFFPVMLLVLSGIPISGFAADEPVNQCIMIPEVITGPSSSGNYQPESCIAFLMENDGSYAARSGRMSPEMEKDS
jgi:hypothetical protein